MSTATTERPATAADGVRLPRWWRSAIELADQGRSHEEIGARLRIPATAVPLLLELARDRLGA